MAGIGLARSTSSELLHMARSRIREFLATFYTIHGSMGLT